MPRSSDHRVNNDRIGDEADWLVIAPFDGTVRWHRHVGDVVAPGDAVATVTGEQGSRDCQNPLDADAVVTGIYREHVGSVNKGTPLFMLSLHRPGWRELSTEQEGLRVGLMHVPAWELSLDEPLVEPSPEKPRFRKGPEPPAERIVDRPNFPLRPRPPATPEVPIYTPPPIAHLPFAPNFESLQREARFACLAAEGNVVVGIWLLSLFLASSAETEASVWVRSAAQSLALFALFTGAGIARQVRLESSWLAAVKMSLGITLSYAGLTIVKDSGPEVAKYVTSIVLFTMTPTVPGYLHGLAAVAAIRDLLGTPVQEGLWWFPTALRPLVKRSVGRAIADMHLLDRVTTVMSLGLVVAVPLLVSVALPRALSPMARGVVFALAALWMIAAWLDAGRRYATKASAISVAKSQHDRAVEEADKHEAQAAEEAWQKHQRAVEEAETRYAVAVEEAERHYKRTVEERERQHVRAVEAARVLHELAAEKHREELRLIEASNRAAQEVWLRESSLSLDRSERIWEEFDRLEDEYALPTFFSLRLPPSERFIEVVGGTRLGWSLLARQLLSGLRERASQLGGGGPIFVIDVSDLSVGDECVKSVAARTKTQPMSSLAGALAAWTLQTRGGADALAGLLATSLAGAQDSGMSVLVWHQLLVDVMAAVGNEMTLRRLALALRVLAGELDGEAADWDDTLAERVRRVASRSRSASPGFVAMCSQTAALLRRLPDGPTGMPALGVVSIAGSLRHTSDQQIARLALQGLELWLAGTSGPEKPAGLIVLGSELLSRSDCDGLRRACQKAATPLVLFFGDLPVDGASLVAGPSSVLLAMRATNGHVASTLAALIGRERRVEVMSYTRQHGRTASSGHQTSRQEGGSHSTGTGHSATTGSSLSVGLSEGVSNSKTQSRSQGESLSEGESFSESEHSSKSESLSEGTSGARTTNTTNESSSDTSGTNATKTTGTTTGTSTSRGTSSTKSTSATEGESTTDGTSTANTRTEGTLRSETSSTSEADTDSWGVSSGENESIGTSESVSVTQQRTVEFVVEPSRLQRLPDDVFLVVSHAESGRGDIVVGYCDPALESLWCDAPGGRLVPHPEWRATRDDVFFVTTGGAPRSEAWACRGLRGGLAESKG